MPYGTHSQILNGRSVKPIARPGVFRFAYLIRLIVDEPRTQLELHGITKFNTKSIAEFLRELRRCKLVYIDAWEPDSLGRPAAQARYAWCGDSPMKDAPRPRKTPAEHKADSRRRLAAHKNPLLQLGRIAKHAATPNVDNLDP